MVCYKKHSADRTDVQGVCMGARTHTRSRLEKYVTCDGCLLIQEGQAALPLVVVDGSAEPPKGLVVSGEVDDKDTVSARETGRRWQEPANLLTQG